LLVMSGSAFFTDDQTGSVFVPDATVSIVNKLSSLHGS
jgi:hypothetical protein